MITHINNPQNIQCQIQSSNSTSLGITQSQPWIFPREGGPSNSPGNPTTGCPVHTKKGHQQEEHRAYLPLGIGFPCTVPSTPLLPTLVLVFTSQPSSEKPWPEWWRSVLFQQLRHVCHDHHPLNSIQPQQVPWWKSRHQRIQLLSCHQFPTQASANILIPLCSLIPTL